MKRALLCILLVLPVQGDEPWKRHTIDDSSKGADGVRLLDVNGDGLQDIATGWEEGGVVRAYLHPGHAKARARWAAVTVGEVKSAEDAVFADLDGDGAFDVVSSCEGGTRTMFVHWAPASFLDAAAWKTGAIPCTQKKQSWMYALPLQLDGRYGIDLVTGSKGKAAVGWLQAPPDARQLDAWTWHRIHDAGWIMSLQAEDMDGDGDRDVLVSDRKGKNRGVYWLANPGPEGVRAGTAWKRNDIGGGDREVMFLDTGDLDGDGAMDVICAIKGKAISWYRQRGATWEDYEIPLPSGVGSGKSATILDVDGDGRMDVVFSCEHANGDLSGMRWLSWTDSPRTGPWQSHEIGGPPGIKYDRIEVLDVDGDGDRDLLCCEERDQLGVFWYENPFGKK